MTNQHPASAGPDEPPTQPIPLPPRVQSGPPPRRGRGRLGPRVTALALVAGLLGGGVGVAGGYLVAGGDLAPLPSAGAAPVSTVSNPLTGVEHAAAVASRSVVDVSWSAGRAGAGGSGVVLTADGLVLTNNHVVEGAAATNAPIAVTLPDGSRKTARVVGADGGGDLAVLRIEGASGLTPAQLGDSGALRVGQQVVAIGSPLGLEGTVTSGIVSALRREVTGRTELGTAISYQGVQTDAPVNKGNSGGALVDLSGRVVGINSAIATSDSSDGSIGIGFAIPVDQARRVVERITGGR
ncbi:S1C family serine protease [Streptoalloteichus hindustanus]|uniref:Trypsin-like peptidase domain-containing protein n=1 Tax=Streptoalloteichus hindustanus TaxID=2017 RepID=A0A1M5PZQ7_STRHI|nr:trypsin-like peptidase domain-containing protein [Streptoalloteichus hindustanus]SHH07156.1 Trypsin-like peptidase domain-containing protein [Streptoalloteichus hindustanus]